MPQARPPEAARPRDPEAARTAAAEHPEVPTTGEERRLIDEAGRGDATAFEGLVRRYDARVLRLALRIVGSEEEARDVYQEVFLKVFRSLGRFRHECSFETWLFRIVTNVCLDHLRRAAARPERPAAPEPRVEFREAPELRVPDERPDHDPERALGRRELRDRIEAGLAALAPRERLVFELRHYEGMRLRAIGELLDTSEDAVKNCLFRAHRHLRGALRELAGQGSGVLRGRTDPAQAGI